MITLLILTCVNVNDGWWCGPKTHTLRYEEASYKNIVSMEDTTYIEVEKPDMYGVTEVLYGTKSKPSTLEQHPSKKGCLVRIGQAEYIKKGLCSK